MSFVDSWKLFFLCLVLIQPLSRFGPFCIMLVVSIAESGKQRSGIPVHLSVPFFSLMLMWLHQ